MKGKLKVGSYIGLVNILINLTPVSAANGNNSANLSIGMLVLIIPLMIGIIYLAGKKEVE